MTAWAAKWATIFLAVYSLGVLLQACSHPRLPEKPPEVGSLEHRWNTAEAHYNTVAAAAEDYIISCRAEPTPECRSNTLRITRAESQAYQVIVAGRQLSEGIFFKINCDTPEDCEVQRRQRLEASISSLQSYITLIANLAR